MNSLGLLTCGPQVRASRSKAQGPLLEFRVNKSPEGYFTLANNSRGVMCGKHGHEPDSFSARKVAQVPEENQVPKLMIQPCFRLSLSTIKLPRPANGVPGAVGSGLPMVVVRVGSGRACFSGYLIPLEGQLDFWPSDYFVSLRFTNASLKFDRPGPAGMNSPDWRLPAILK